MKIEGRKYEATLPDGRVVSRQRAHQIKLGEKYREQKKEYMKKYHAEFEEKHGMTLHYWNKKIDERKKK